MKGSLQIGRILGIPLQFHWTFLLVFAWVLYSNWHPGWGMDWDNIQWLGIWVSLVFLAVLLHELGHALMARRLGIHTERIVLYPIGGGAFLERMPNEPLREILIALAGPMVNFLLAAMLIPIIWGSGDHRLTDILLFFFKPGSNVVLYDIATWEYLVVVFFVLNALLGVFNLLPAFPLDGGRVLRAALNMRWSRMQATVIAVTIGMLCSVAMLGLAYWIEDIIFAMGAVLIFILGWAELNVQRRRWRLQQAKVGDHLETPFHRLYVDNKQKLVDARVEVQEWADNPILLLDEWQQPRGVIRKATLLDRKLDQHSQQPIAELLGPPKWVGLHPEEDLLHAAEQLDEAKLHAFPVFDKYGRIVGLLDRERIEHVMNGKA